MARLWDKGAPLDERVLRFTAGESDPGVRRVGGVDKRRVEAPQQGQVSSNSDFSFATMTLLGREAPR